MSQVALSVSFEYLCYYGYSSINNISNAGIDFRRQNLTSIDVRFWRLRSVPALKGLDHNPYFINVASCGSWGAMDDYYDGHQCVSASFIVGMAAGLGALIILILVCIIIWLANDRNKMAKQLGSE